MKVGIFTRGMETHSYKYEQAFANGLKAHGHTVLDYPWNSEPGNIDLAVIWSIKNIRLITYFKERNINYVVLERGYIGDREKWTSCGFNGLNGHADFCNKDSDDKRLHHVKKYMKPIREEKGDYIVIMGQVSGDSSVKYIGFNNWLDKIYKEIRHEGRGRLYYRPHPLEKEPYIPEGLEVIKGSLKQVICNAHCVATLNSNSGVDAILAGVPVFADDEGSMVRDLRMGIFDSISTPYIPEERRNQWLKDMSYTQWTIEEMELGETWDHLKKRYEK